MNWAIPVLALQSMGSTLSRSLSGTTDLTLSHPPFDSSAAGVRFAQLSSGKLSLDQSTFLPTSLSFNIHPDHDESINIPIVVRYSDLRKVSGASIPFHIEKYLNNGLTLDLRVENASVQ